MSSRAITPSNGASNAPSSTGNVAPAIVNTVDALSSHIRCTVSQGGMVYHIVRPPRFTGFDGEMYWRPPVRIVAFEKNGVISGQVTITYVVPTDRK